MRLGMGLLVITWDQTNQNRTGFCPQHHKTPLPISAQTVASSWPRNHNQVLPSKARSVRIINPRRQGHVTWVTSHVTLTCSITDIRNWFISSYALRLTSVTPQGLEVARVFINTKCMKLTRHNFMYVLTRHMLTWRLLCASAHYMCLAFCPLRERLVKRGRSNRRRERGWR